MIKYINNLNNSEFEQIQKDLEKFKSHAHMKKEDTKKLTNYLYKLERLIADENYPELEYTAECFVCVIRDIVAETSVEIDEEIMMLCADNMGITIQIDNDILKVTLPMILPTQSKSKSAYLFEPIFFAMKEFTSKMPIFIDEDAIMCIEHIYDKNKNIPRGDHDNKEIKQIIDAISAFVIPDDSDNYLSLYQCSSDGEYNHTNVYVMNKKQFGKFVSDRIDKT